MLAHRLTPRLDTQSRSEERGRVTRRRVMVALLACTAVLAMPAGAGVRHAHADVTLQIVPRGNGTVTSNVAGASAACTANEEPDFCERTVASGSTVVLS